MDLERKYKIFEEQSEVIPKALHCYPFCFLSTKTVCIINVWGCAEILCMSAQSECKHFHNTRFDLPLSLHANYTLNPTILHSLQQLQTEPIFCFARISIVVFDNSKGEDAHRQPKLTLRARILLRNSGHGENIRVCMGIFTTGFRR